MKEISRLESIIKISKKFPTQSNPKSEKSIFTDSSSPKLESQSPEPPRIWRDFHRYSDPSFEKLVVEDSFIEINPPFKFPYPKPKTLSVTSEQSFPLKEDSHKTLLLTFPVFLDEFKNLKEKEQKEKERKVSGDETIHGESSDEAKIGPSGMGIISRIIQSKRSKRGE